MFGKLGLKESIVESHHQFVQATLKQNCWRHLHWGFEESTSEELFLDRSWNKPSFWIFKYDFDHLYDLQKWNHPGNTCDNSSAGEGKNVQRATELCSSKFHGGFKPIVAQMVSSYDKLLHCFASCSLYIGSLATIKRGF
ncbi:unnamed protein product [Lactuca virosa]|uniref:Uncharacterized protein n=1 Tax=Lactuca virosa TaxID=75947 RepID=A0AAU9LKD1_9ASTR|nr:unnamed protein product [Lactuca virosa]